MNQVGKTGKEKRDRTRQDINQEGKTGKEKREQTEQDRI